MEYFVINPDGFIVDIAPITPVKAPNTLVRIDAPEGLYKPRYDFIKEEFVEGMEQSEIDVLKNAVQPLSELEQLQKDQADLVLQLVLKGVL